MCPSFRVTRDEEHSTRGRAHLLWEMTKGDVIKDGWQNEAVKDSLDLCLACKGCKSDCPVGVDVATYKAEFLSHYYETNRRPLNALAFANIDLWARAASHAPGLVNLATQLPGLRDLAKLVGGIPAQRRIPAFAPQTFKQWWERQTRATTLQVPASATPALPSYSGPTRSTITSCLRPPKPPSKSSKPRGSRSASRAPTCAAAARSTTSACWIAPRACCSRSWTSCSQKSKRPRPSSFLNRAAPPFSATN